mgnify:CR=1 FL=1
MKRIVLFCLPVFLVAFQSGRADQELSSDRFWQSTEKEDYTIDREPVFEFAEKPTFKQDGDRVTISFQTKGFCDVTIAIEDTSGKILRHLASGVLGPNAPAPFEKNSKAQNVVWDGKNDLGRYIDEKDKVVIRVSLGLKPQFEKTLFWHPKKELGRRLHLHMEAQPEGVYVYSGGGVETIRLFGHDGKYIRTVYPFPSKKVGSVKGLGWNSFADGWKSPRHIGYTHAGFLPSGAGEIHASWGSAARCMAVGSGRIVLPGCVETKSPDKRLARFSADGRVLDCGLYGPPLETNGFFPTSMAFSPDGEWIYLTGFMSIRPTANMVYAPWRHAVLRMKFDSDKPPKPWLGSWKKPGKDNSHFEQPASVCVDAKGRVYVADNLNDRVQIFSPKGKLLKSLPVNGPAELQIHHKTQELYVFSWATSVFFRGHCSETRPHPKGVDARLRVFSPFKSNKPEAMFALPLQGYRNGAKNILFQNSYHDPIPFRAMLNSYADPDEIWLVTGTSRCTWHPGRGSKDLKQENIRRFHMKDNKLVEIENWNKPVVAAVRKWRHSDLGIQRLLTDPRDGTLYVMDSTYKYADSLVRIRPDSGKVDVVPMPYQFEDAAIDWEGHIMLRWNRIIGRFTLDTLREVPYDYGEERKKFSVLKYKNGGSLVSAIVLPGHRSSCGFESGMGANARGEIAVAVCNSKGKRYKPSIWPGRFRYHEIHVFNRHGKPVGMDIVGQGAPPGHGIQVDFNGDVYFLTTQNRRYGKRNFYPESGTVIKFKRGRGRFITAGSRGLPLPLPAEQRPDVPPQLGTTPFRGEAYWVRDAEWMYPGVGFGRTWNCYCWNARFTVDAFGRSFLPQFIRCQVAVLDTNGNLVMQIGRYGNVDDGKPLVTDQRFRTQTPRSIGGDEVALMYANYTGTHSDRRLFIADAGNGRILSVKLGYHTEERLSLK